MGLNDRLMQETLREQEWDARIYADLVNIISPYQTLLMTDITDIENMFVK